MEIILKEHNRQAVTGWVKKITPLIEAALKKNANKAHDPEGDLHSMNLCGEAGKAIQQEDLSPHGIVGGQLFGVVANGHAHIDNALHFCIEHLTGQTVCIDAAYVDERLQALSQDDDLSRFIL